MSTTESVFVHIDNRWRLAGLATQVRKAFITLATKEIHADPSARLALTVAKSMGIVCVEHIADWTTRGGAIERTRSALAKCGGVLVITEDIAAPSGAANHDRYALNVLRQARTANLQGYVLDNAGFTMVDMESVPPFKYTELDNTPFANDSNRKLAKDVWPTDADQA